MKEEVFEEESSSVVWPVLISGAIGAGLALLLAPKSGKDIRSDISRLASRTGEQATEALEETKSAASEAYQTGRQSLAQAQEAISEASDSSEGRSLLVPILVSGAIGAAVALLFAPKPGREVVSDLKDFASTAYEKGKGYYEQGMSSVRETMEKGKEAAAETKEKLRPAA